MPKQTREKNAFYSGDNADRSSFDRDAILLAKVGMGTERTVHSRRRR